MPKKLTDTKRRSRKVKISDEGLRLFLIQQEAFREKFGRDPEDDDPIFFDPDASDPEPVDPTGIQEMILEAMCKAHTPPQIMFAFMRTGLLVMEETKKVISPDDLADWDAAIDDYFRLEDEAARRLN